MPWLTLDTHQYPAGVAEGLWTGHGGEKQEKVGGGFKHPNLSSMPARTLSVLLLVVPVSGSGSSK